MTLDKQMHFRCPDECEKYCTWQLTLARTPRQLTSPLLTCTWAWAQQQCSSHGLLRRHSSRAMKAASCPFFFADRGESPASPATCRASLYARLFTICNVCFNTLVSFGTFGTCTRTTGPTALRFPKRLGFGIDLASCPLPAGSGDEAASSAFWWRDGAGESWWLEDAHVPQWHICTRRWNVGSRDRGRHLLENRIESSAAGMCFEKSQRD